MRGAVNLEGLGLSPGLRQRDGVSCGPAVAVLSGALLDPSYARLADPAWFAAEQGRVHAAANRVWPRGLGTTPWGLAAVLTSHSGRHGVRYGWRLGRHRLVDVRRAVDAHWPVLMLIGDVIPRHWVLIVEFTGPQVRCYEPSSGEIRTVATEAVRAGRLTGLGFGRPFAFVLPRYRVPTRHSNI